MAEMKAIPNMMAPAALRNALRRAFELPPLIRGCQIEKLLGAGGLSPNYPRFDLARYVADARFEFVSIKSRDLRCSRYRSLSTFERRARKDIDAVATVERIPQWQYAARRMSLIAFDQSMVAGLKLLIVVCGAERHPEFSEAALRLMQYADSHGVILEILCA